MLTTQRIVRPPPPQPALQVILQTPTPVPLPGVPTPGVALNLGVPDSYVWDGSEYIGFIGDQYYYVAPGNVWLPLSGNHLNRFHDWEEDHPDWRAHAIRNERFRRDAQGKVHLWTTHDADHHDHDGR
jgi:hypothetical protein